MIKRNKINRNKVKSGMSRRKKILLSAMIASSLLFADGLYTTYVYADGGQQFHGISVNVEGAGGVSGNNYNNDGAGYLSVAIGIGASSQAGYGTAIGPDAKADALGSNATGFYAQALGQYSAAYGAGAKAINAFGVAFGQGAVVSFGKHISETEYNGYPDIIKKLYTAVKTEEGKTVYYKTKILLQDGSTQDQSIFSVAIGASAAATDNHAVAIGFKSSADATGAVGIGAFTEAKGKQGLALGYVAKAIGDFSTAVGQWSQANGDHAVAIGYGAITEKNKAGVAIGYESHSMRIGGNGWNPITDQVWDGSEAQIEALGLKEKVKALDEEIAQKQALEDQAKAALAQFPNDPDLIEKARVAHNEKAKADEKKNKLFATWKTPTGDVAVGNSDTGMTRQITGVAAGSEDTDAVNVAQLKALNRKNVTQLNALNSKVDTFDTKIENVKKIVDDNKIHYFAVGPDNEKNYTPEGNYNNDGVEQHGGIAIGFNASSKDGDGIAIGKSAQARGWQSIGIGEITYSIGDFSTSIGTRAQAFGERASAYGSLARAYGANGVAIGTGTLVASKKAITKAEFDLLSKEQKAWYNTDKVNQQEFYQYRGIDKDGEVKDIETNGTAVGNGAKSIGSGGTAVGHGASSIGTSGVAVGDHAKASDIDNVNGSDFGVAIGAYSQNKVAQGVALGASSVSDRAENILGYLPNKNGIIENLEDAMEAVGKGKEFTDLKNEYTQAQAEMNAAKVASDGNPGNPDLKMKYEQEKQKFDALTNKYAIMTAPWTSRKGAVSIGNDKKGQTRQLIGVAAGSEDTDAVNVAQLKALNDKVDKGSIHYFSVNSGKPAKLDGTNWSNDGAIGEDAVAIGNRAKAQGKSSTALGTGAKAQGKSSTALGNAAKAEKESSTALGYRAIAKEESSTALGYSAKAQGKSSTALGYDAKAKGESSTALGNAAKAEKEFSTALGYRAIAKGVSSTALGNAAQAEKEFSTALGYRAIAKGVSSMALGREAQALVDGSVALGEGTVAGRAAGKVGYVASAGDTTFDAVLTALGKKTDYDNWTATINPLKETYDNLTKAYFGAQSSREGVAAKDALDKWKGEHKEFLDALEEKSKLEATWRATKAAVSVGVDGVNKAGNRIIESRQITHVAAGSEDTDAVNVAQLKVLNTKVDKGAVHYFSVNSTDKGEGSNWKNDGATGKDAVAIGVGAKAQGYYSTALGSGAQAKTYHSTALGHGAIAKGDSSTALGYGAEAQGYSSMALGKGVIAQGSYSTALGDGAQARVDGSVALGEGTVAGREAGTVGYLASAGGTTFDDVLNALGKKTEYNNWKNKIDESKAEYNRLTNAYFNASESGKAAAKTALETWKVNHKEFLDALEKKSKLEATWKATKAAVSVGADGLDEVGNRIIESRQITNVAAGTQDTDAVNVAQLKALNSKVTTNTGDITTLKKGWTLEDGNTGTKTVKAEGTVKVTGDEYITATVDNDGLKLGMNETKLNTQINNQIDNSTTVKNKMNSWVLKAASDKDAEKAGKTINNTDNDVTFDVETGQGLTVARDGATIKYGVNNKQLVGNINSGDTAVTNISAKFSVTDGTNTKAVNLGKDKNNNVKFLGTAGETTVTVGGNDDAPTVTVGLAQAFKDKVTKNATDITNLTTRVNANSDNIAANTEKIGKNTTAIGENKTAIGENKTAIGENKTAIGENKTAIGENKTAIGENKTAIGENKTAIGENKTAIGENKTAIGENKTAIGENKTAIGENKTAIGENKTAIGENKTAIGENKTAIGENKTAIGENKTAIGENKTAIGENKTAIGENKTAIGENKTAIAGKMTSWKLKAGGVEGEAEIKDGNAVTFDVAEKDQGLTVTRDGSTIKYGIDGSKIDLSNNASIKKLKTVVKAGDENISVTKADDKEEYTVTLAKDLKDLNSVSAKTVNADTVKASGKVTVGDKVTLGTTGLTIKDGPSVTAVGIYAGKKKITSVAAGDVSVNSTDAVNGGQLFGVEQKVNINNQNIAIIGGKVGELGNRVNRVGAGAAALAALHPLDFDPYNRSQIMAGVSTYKGQEAIALGLAYYSNENTLLHAGLSYAGSSELMANAGISYRFGSSYDRKFLEERNKLMPQYKGGVISSVYVMQDEMTKLQKENEILKEKNAKAEAENKEMKSELEILKKQVSKLMEKI